MSFSIINGTVGFTPAGSSTAAISYISDGGFAWGLDIYLPAKLNYLSFTNNSTSDIYLQIHSKATALTTIVFSIADFPTTGWVFCPNQRIALSSTFDTYTAATVANTSLHVQYNV